ncbi:cytochrome c oxidase accessory protein CcoG [Gimesia chilikensis]|uniref:Electron transport protein YccM n=1 Tax=Gimesia chilikensis TaxID=2605989 RepID=A0A517PPB3_9PLAN|nr:cytochrome c oxidase accessory protein CcoG [Gimesia chilikensis]QDT21188.1 Putative electron transport protein YccM [Gimesia chilikensis]QDT84368.1 Putative electron transport protein YccM [Gimesia chilikensis]
MSDQVLEPEEHVLSTLEKDGSRRWMYPRLFKGKFWNRRRIVGYFLIVLFIVLPHLQVNSRPAIFLNITRREFTIFGFTFLPTDTLLLAFFMISVFLSIFLLTALFGRVWCGWACPQTIYLEFVYRPIERLFCGTTGHGGKPRKPVPLIRRVMMYGAYLIISMILAHTFLAYFVSVSELQHWVRQSPFTHPTGFLVMTSTVVLMMFNFSFFREQLCTIACPYGRFQSVLLDRRSLIVSYDPQRGEPRGKISKTDPTPKGDCIDCGQCVQACPTGIDIRDGLQMECLHCTQCMDACDEIMVKVDRPLGLVRYSCQDEIDGQPTKKLRPRVIIYPLLLLLSVSAFTITLLNKKSFDITIMRNYGNPFIVTEDDQVENNLQLKLVNRTDQPDEYTIKVLDAPDVTMELIGSPDLKARETKTIPMLVSAPRKSFVAGLREVELSIQSQNQADERRVTCQILGP